LAGPPESCADARVKYEVRPLNLAANRALGGRRVEVHHAANHAKFGPRAQRTTLADVLAVPGRRHEQWQCFAGYAGDKLVGAGAAITTRDNPHVGTAGRLRRRFVARGERSTLGEPALPLA
jgi:hypothetical protein